MTNYEIIMRIKKRPGMYLGSNSITALSIFLGGYAAAEHDMGMLPDKSKRKTLLPLDFWYMHEFAAVVYGYYESTAGWRGIILEGCGGDEKAALQKFFELYELFCNVRIKSIHHAVLDEDNIAYCKKHGPYHEKYNFEENRFERIGAVFDDPREVFIINLETAGGEYEFDMLITECEKITVETQFLFSDRGERAERKTAEKYAEKLFGSLYYSECGTQKNYVFKNKVENYYYWL